MCLRLISPRMCVLSTAFLRFSCTLFSKYEAEIEIERERGRDKDLDISRIEKWFYIIKQIEVITAAYPQSTNCAHSASLWCQRLQTVADDLITVSQWCKCCRDIVAIHKPFSWMQSSEKSEISAFISLYVFVIVFLLFAFLLPLICFIIWFCYIYGEKYRNEGDGKVHFSPSACITRAPCSPLSGSCGLKLSLQLLHCFAKLHRGRPTGSWVWIQHFSGVSF